MTIHNSGLLDISDPEVHARIRSGIARWRGGVAPEELPLPEEGEGQPDAGKILLGLLLLGGGIVAGLFVMFLALCIVACGEAPAAALLVFLLGLAILILGARAGVRLLIEGAGGSVSAAGGFGARRVVAAHACSLRASDGWVEVPVARDGRLIAVEAEGLLRHPGQWFSDADGSPIAEIPGSPVRVEGAPPGALLGRVGEEVFFLGRGGAVPEGPPGPLELAINTTAPCIGHLLARITVIEAGA